MPNYSVKCSKCGKESEIFRWMSQPNPLSECCKAEQETLITNTTEAIWYTDCPTASGGNTARKVKRVEGFVDDKGKEHKIKYHHGTAISNSGERGYT